MIDLRWHAALVAIGLCLMGQARISWAEAPPAGAPTAATASEDDYPTGTLPDSAGGTLPLDQAKGRMGTALVCMSVECPISNEYIPTLNRLAEEYRGRDVRFIGMNPSAGQTLRQMADHARDFQLAFPFVKDTGGQISRRLKMKVTPEVCLFDGEGHLVYRGRIDDRYRARGGAANEVVDADLRRAIDELLAKKPASVPRTKAIGCPIQFTSASQHAPAVAATVNYSRHVAPLLQEHCQECHRPGGMGTFDLTTYEQAVSWADDIRQFTASGAMPPWKPVAGFGEFKHRRALSDADKQLIAHWVEQGCAEGDPGDLPPARKFAESWRLGEPDLVLEPEEDYHLAADGPDDYRNFVLPVAFDHDRFISAVEFIPGNARVVHHILTFLDDTGVAQRLDAQDPGPGYSWDSQGGLPGFVPLGGVTGLGGWAPGNSMGLLPDGIARILPKQARIVMQVHYHKSGKPETDRTRIGIHFAKAPVKRIVSAVPVMPTGGPLSGMRIPAGAADHEVRASFVMPDGGLALSITPHMHLLGKDMKVTLTHPDGRVEPMIWVKDWDFNWQELYHYQQFVDLPAGSRLDLVAHFDNSADNPRNPARPPKTVCWGEGTNDEMCIAFLEVVPYREAASESELKLPDRSAVAKYLFEGQTGRLGSAAPPVNPLKQLSERLFTPNGKR